MYKSVGQSSKWVIKLTIRCLRLYLGFHMSQYFKAYSLIVPCISWCGGYYQTISHEILVMFVKLYFRTSDIYLISLISLDASGFHLRTK